MSPNAFPAQTEWSKKLLYYDKTLQYLMCQFWNSVRQMINHQITSVSGWKCLIATITVLVHEVHITRTAFCIKSWQHTINVHTCICTLICTPTQYVHMHFMYICKGKRTSMNATVSSSVFFPCMYTGFNCVYSDSNSGMGYIPGRIWCC